MNENSNPPTRTDRSEIVRFSRWLFSWRIFRKVLFLAICFATLVALFYAFENWRGKREWLRFKTEWEAKGERFDIASVIPASVPADQNFAMTPLLAPLLDYQYVGEGRSRHIEWRDTNGIARIERVQVFGPKSPGTPGNIGAWARKEPTDLKKWQEYFQSNTNFPSAAQSQDPARDVLTALSVFDAELNELTEASRRPYSVFPVRYEDNYSALLRHLARMKALAQTFALRAVARLEASDTRGALDDVRVGYRLAEAVKSEPLLISQLVRIAVVQIATQPVWHGMMKKQWSPAELAEIQRITSAIDIISEFPKSIRGERNLSNEFIRRFMAGEFDAHAIVEDPNDAGLRWVRFAPNGWFYHGQVIINRYHNETALPAIDLDARRLADAKQIPMDEPPELQKRSPRNFLAHLLLPALSRSVVKFALGQSAVDRVAVACALERFYAEHQRYPESLTELQPKFISRIPHDVITGEPLKYNRTSNGRFVLYSVGIDRKDDGGKAMIDEKNADAPRASRSAEDGDWVWAYPVDTAGTPSN